MGGYPQELEDFADCILEGREPISGLDLAVDTVNVIYSAYLAAERGQRVQLDAQ
jgi:predicted dehydrogenase